MRRPVTCGATPRRVVSTSGSSGIGRRVERLTDARATATTRRPVVGVAIVIYTVTRRGFADPPPRQPATNPRRTSMPSCPRLRAARHRRRHRPRALRRRRRSRRRRSADAAAQRDPRPPQRPPTSPTVSRPTSSTGSCSATSPCSVASSSLAARAYLDAARETRDRAPRAARHRDRARRPAARARDRRGAPVELDRPDGRAAAADPRRDRGRRRRHAPADGGAEDLRARLERLLAEAATSGPGVGEVFLQLNGAFAQQSDKRAVLALIRDSPSRIRRRPRRISPSRSRRTARCATTRSRASRR